MKKPSLKKVERPTIYSATNLDKSDYAQRGAESNKCSQPNLVSRLSTCVATALLPPVRTWSASPAVSQTRFQ